MHFHHLYYKYCLIIVCVKFRLVKLISAALVQQITFCDWLFFFRADEDTDAQVILLGNKALRYLIIRNTAERVMRPLSSCLASENC